MDPFIGMLFLVIVPLFIFFFILYFVIKAAVRNGIIEARDDAENGESIAKKAGTIAQVLCPTCLKEHDMDYSKCPYCGGMNHE